MRDEISITEKIQLLSKKSINLEKFTAEDDAKKNYHFFPRLVSKTLNQNKWFYPLAQSTWGEEEHSAIIQQLNTGQLTMGENVEKFEKDFASYVGTKYAIMVNSGSSANLLIVSALTLLSKYNFNKDDEVIVPALGWSTSFSPFTQHGIKLKFIDIDDQTLNIDPEKIKAAITKKTKAVLAINILGNPIEFDRVKKICDSNKLILIEDNCESLGSKYNSMFSGTFGVASSHSFFFSHHIQTIEGGMITTNDKDICEYTKSLRAHGWTRGLTKNNYLEKSPTENFHNQFKFILPGYNLRPNEFNGALGLVQLRKLPDFLKARNENSNLFKNLFADKTYCTIQKCDQDSSWYGFSLILEGDLEGKRDMVINELYTNGIETRPVVTGNFVKNPVCNFMEHEVSGVLTKTEKVDRNGFFVGNSHINLEDQLLRLSEILKKLSKK